MNQFIILASYVCPCRIIFKFMVRYRSIITSFLHAYTRVVPHGFTRVKCQNFIIYTRWGRVIYTRQGMPQHDTCYYTHVIIYMRRGYCFYIHRLSAEIHKNQLLEAYGYTGNCISRGTYDHTVLSVYFVYCRYSDRDSKEPTTMSVQQLFSLGLVSEN